MFVFLQSDWAQLFFLPSCLLQAFIDTAIKTVVQENITRPSHQDASCKTRKAGVWQSGNHPPNKFKKHV